MQRLYVMCGPSASGKSTWAASSGAHVVSRDRIRFSLMREGDGYFDHEDQVLALFCAEVSLGLARGADVVADATHLDRKSRSKLFKGIAIDRDRVEVVSVHVRAALEECLRRNSRRKGLERVPDEVLVDQFRRWIRPSFDEGFDEILEAEML